MPREGTSGVDARTKTAFLQTPYVRSVLCLYCSLPQTPAKPTRDDIFVTRLWQRQNWPLIKVQAALLLGAARRLLNPRIPGSQPLPGIHSIRYFQPVLEEFRFATVRSDYLDYLERKLSEFCHRQITRDPPPLSADTGKKPLIKRHPRQLELPW